MKYRGYEAKIEYDEEAGLFHGEVLDLRDVITFQGRSVEELKQALADSVEDYIEFCKTRGEEPEKPFSGQFVVRTEAALHRACAAAARRAGVSLNRWVVDTLSDAVTPTRGGASEGPRVRGGHGGRTLGVHSTVRDRKARNG